MDYSELYDYVFEHNLKMLEDERDSFKENSYGSTSTFNPIIDLGYDNFSIYTALVSSCEGKMFNAVKEVLLEMLRCSSVSYELFPSGQTSLKKHHVNLEPWRETPFLFSVSIEERKTHYCFYDEKNKALQLYENSGVTHVEIIYLGNPNEVGWQILVEEQRKHNTKSDLSIHYITLEQLFVAYFEPDEYSRFMVYMDNFVVGAKHLIGFNIVITPTDEAKEKERALKELRDYKYIDIATDLSPDDEVIDVKCIHERYIGRGLYNAMTSDTDFAKSFISSEWFYTLNDITDSLEKTGIVYGYFKSVEQLLTVLVSRYKDKGRTMMNRDATETEYTTKNARKIEGSLGSLHRFIESNSDILDVDDRVKRHIKDEIDNWRYIYRNGYAHIENLHEPEKVTMIRAKAIYLYFLILGGFVIQNDQFEQLGIGEICSESDERSSNESVFQDFEKWFGQLLKYGLPKNTVTLCCHLHKHKGKRWSYRLTATSNYDEDNILSFVSDTISSPSASTNLFPLPHACSREEAHNLAVYCIEQYLCNGRYSDILRSYTAVVIIDHKSAAPVDVVYRK